MREDYKYWTNEEIKILRKCYGKVPIEKLMEKLKRTYNSITIKAERIGLSAVKDRYFKTNKKITTNCKDYINGLLLSDGSIRQQNSTAYYQHNCVKREWLESIKELFSRYNIVCTINNGTNHKLSKNLQHHLQTNSYVEFKELRDKWYIEGKKIVPRDIELSPVCVANWYLGDGSCSKRKDRKKKYTICIATCGFKADDVEFLSKELNKKLNIHSYITGRNLIYITSKSDTVRFIDYIKDYWIQCYSYKFPMDLLFSDNKIEEPVKPE